MYLVINILSDWSILTVHIFLFSNFSATKFIKGIKVKKQWHYLYIASLKEIIKICFSYVCDTENDGF